MPCMFYCAVHVWSGECIHGSESAVKFMRHLFACLVEPDALLQLFNTQRGGNICQVVLVSGEENVVAPGTFCSVALPCIFADSMQAHDAHAFGILIIVCGDHSP